ncbi:MAG: uroporphyrinogen-III C-methyltransferase [Planctomycetaceae bacterium]|nr:uroporphyrinogen-III C-methyltransferase [Planctomycetaceae bacterium]
MTDDGHKPAAGRLGKVYLVGAGPGDPGLITVRGRELLQLADLVLYDGLVNPQLLLHVHSRTERTCRVQSDTGKHLPQDEINARLIAAAKQGLTVVRLKGGDPFIFGRGTEEAAALAAEGIPFEVVPGITAATGAAVYAGISLTHRDFASAVAFVTGHESPGKSRLSLDYKALARFPGTLVFYMGLGHLEEIVTALIREGRSRDTPAAVVSRATTPAQQVVTAKLEELPNAVSRARLPAPSLVVIGECVTVREAINWFEQLPLFGKRIGVTRPSHQFLPIAEQIVRLGGEAIPMPMIEIGPPDDWEPVDSAIDRLTDYDWVIFTSQNGVEGFLGRVWEQGRDARCFGGMRLAAIGEQTARSLERFGLKADLIPADANGEALAAAISLFVEGKRVVWPKANRGRDVLPKILAERGATVDEVVVYRNQDLASLPSQTQQRLVEGNIDWIAMSSPSIARNLTRLLPRESLEKIGTTIRLAAISPLTAEAAQEVGLPVAATASESTWDAMLAAIAEAP